MRKVNIFTPSTHISILEERHDIRLDNMRVKIVHANVSLGGRLKVFRLRMLITMKVESSGSDLNLLAGLTNFIEVKVGSIQISFTKISEWWGNDQFDSL